MAAQLKPRLKAEIAMQRRQFLRGIFSAGVAAAATTYIPASAHSKEEWLSINEIRRLEDMPPLPRAFSKEEIAAAFKVPPQLVGDGGYLVPLNFQEQLLAAAMGETSVDPYDYDDDDETA